MNNTLNDFFNGLNDDDKEIYSEIADFAYELGYKPKRARTKDINYVFTNNKTKIHLLKFSYTDGQPKLKLKYFATDNYSGFFHEAIKNTIEEFNFKYTGCYKCGRCKDKPLGYIYEYPDGKKYFRCGRELICLPPLTQNEVPEILKLLKTQHEYHLLNNE